MYCKESSFVVLFLLSFILSVAQPVGYQYGKQITVNASEVVGPSSLTDFPMMVRFMGAGADLDLRSIANGGHVESATGYDIIFTSDQAGANVLDHQIESYNAATGEYVAWVRIPTLSNSVQTNIFMYYGNCSISSDPSTSNVWNSDYDAVYFLHDNFNDATSNGNTGTNNGSSDLSPALIADGQSFGVNDYIQIPSASISSGQGTVSIWAYASSFSGTEQYMYGHTSNPSGFSDRIQLYTDDGAGGLDLGLGNNHNLQQGIYTMNTGEWYHIVLTWNGTTCFVYVNGNLEHSENYGGLNTLESYLDIGNDGRATGSRNEGWDGDLDHARLSDEVFDANWIRTEYNNQREGSSFYSVGAEFSAVHTFYSRATGAWEANNSWSFSSDGSSGAVPVGVFPHRSDNVVIQSGHNITINNVNDNGLCAQSPDGLGLSNVGPFAGSNLTMFYQSGDIVINGTLTVTGIEMMTDGYVKIESGAIFNLTSSYVNLGYFEADNGSSFSSADDFILAGNSTTIINTNSISNDDLIISYTDATLCGSGTTTLQNGSGSLITFANGATLSQVCTQYTVDCTGSGCSGFPVTGTGTFFSGIVGPGGVGDQNTNEIWLMADQGAYSDVGTTLAVDLNTVRQWNDISGNGRNAFQNTAGNRPIYRTGQDNGVPALQFTGNLFIDSPSLGIAGTSDLTYFITFRDTSTGLGGINDGSGHYILDRTTATNALMSLKPITGNVYTLQKRSDGGTGLGGPATTTSINTNIKWVEMTRDNGTAYNFFYNGVSENSLADGDGNLTPPAMRIGRHATTANGGLRGFIHELFVYSSLVNNAQRIIINNYLTAKYGMSLSVNDVYTMDNPANGNYDFEVAGIGRASDGSYHKDARGNGVVRMWNPKGLGNSEFLIWGHDGTALTTTTTVSPADVDGTVIEERLSRIWRVSETGDVGTVSISFDFNGVGGSPLGSNLRLLIDRDGDGFGDNDVTPIVGSVSNGIAVFSNINFNNGDRFTLGNTDALLPLPIELIEFTAAPSGKKVLLSWVTASELNNDFFTVERSVNAEEWQEVSTLAGAGTSLKTNRYELTDDQPIDGASYYRIKQTDYNGSISYSEIRLVKLDETQEFNVFPNPSQGQFTLEGLAEGVNYEARVLNSLGQLVNVRIDRIGNKLVTDLSSLPEGIYIMQISNGSVLQSIRLVRNR